MERAMEVGEGVLTPGRYAVEALPFLRYIPSWLPGGRFKQYAAQVKTEVEEIVSALFEAARDNRVRRIHLYAVLTGCSHLRSTRVSDASLSFLLFLVRGKTSARTKPQISKPYARTWVLPAMQV